MILFKDAATYYEQELHQQLAWEWLQKNVDEETINLFAEKYVTRNELSETFKRFEDHLIRIENKMDSCFDK